MTFQKGDRVRRQLSQSARERGASDRGTVMGIDRDDQRYFWVMWDNEREPFKYRLAIRFNIIEPLSVVDRLAELADA